MSRNTQADKNRKLKGLFNLQPKKQLFAKLKQLKYFEAFKENESKMTVQAKKSVR